MTQLLTKEIERVRKWQWPRISGRVTHVIGMIIESIGPEVCVGEMCYVYGKAGKKVPCQVVGIKEHKVLLMALSEMAPIALGAEVFPVGEVHQVPVSFALCGRVLDALGNPIDGKGALEVESFYPVTAPPPSPLEREPIADIFPTHIKAIDAFVTLGRGQRIGIISPAGVGKSTLMGMIARRAAADVNVIALIGERGREVRDFIEKELGPEGLARSVIVVATADQPATLRSKGAHLATAIAEYFRDASRHVLLMMDSITRYALAVAEIGLAIGEPPTWRGYPPSLSAALPALLERAGNDKKGSITGIYTLLAEGETVHDPLVESLQSLLDGHIVLSRRLAAANHFPPIDILRSLSRVMHDVADKTHQANASQIRDRLAAYQEIEELMQVGAYAPGSNPKGDRGLAQKEALTTFLRQESGTSEPLAKTLQKLSEIAK